MLIFEICGYIAGICTAVCFLPQAPYPGQQGDSDLSQRFPALPEGLPKYSGKIPR